MKKLSKDEIKELILKLFNENRLIAVLNGPKCVIYYYENSDVIELKLRSTYETNHYFMISSIINEITESMSDVFYRPGEAIIVLKNINQKIIDKGYLKLGLDDTDLHYGDIVAIGLIFPNPKYTVFIDYRYLTNNIIKLFPLEFIQHAISVRDKLKNKCLSVLDSNFKFIDKRIKSLSDEEKLLLKL